MSAYRQTGGAGLDYSIHMLDFDLTPLTAEVTTACKGADYVTNRAVAVNPGPCKCSGPIVIRKRGVRLCQVAGVAGLVYLPEKKVKVPENE